MQQASKNLIYSVHLYLFTETKYTTTIVLVSQPPERDGKIVPYIITESKEKLRSLRLLLFWK